MVYGDAENRGRPTVSTISAVVHRRRAMVPAMRYVTVAIRSLLGLIFLASGLNGFLHRFPNPAMLTQSLFVCYFGLV